MPPLDLGEAFVHVVNEHRWLSASACSWKLIGPKAARTPLKIKAHELVPNIDVMALDSVLLHARALIDFYTNIGRSCDVLLKNFGLTIDTPIVSALSNFKRPIEVHALHITNWRDISYRIAYSSDMSTLRPDWNKETSKLVTTLYKALRFVSNQGGDWRIPFRELYKASRARYSDKSFVWPKHLGEKADIFHYLDGLNL